MFKLDYSRLRSDSFAQALKKISACTDFDPKTAYRIMRTSKVLNDVFLDSQKEWVALLSKYVPKDGNSWKMNESGSDFLWNEGVNPEQVKKEIKEFGEKTIEVERYPFSLEELAPAKLSASEMDSLGELIIPPIE